MPNSPEPFERRLLDLAWKENLCALSAGLTHDFCNIMTGIVSLSEALLSDKPANQAARDGLTLIRDTALQAGQLAQRVHRLQQEAPGQKSFLDLNQEVSSHAALLHKLLSRRISIKTELEPGPLAVEADPVELRQVILSLALDAANAMPQGGHLLFRTARLDSLPTEVKFRSSNFAPQHGQPWVQFTLEHSIEAGGVSLASATEAGRVTPCAPPISNHRPRPVSVITPNSSFVIGISFVIRH